MPSRPHHDGDRIESGSVREVNWHRDGDVLVPRIRVRAPRGAHRRGDTRDHRTSRVRPEPSRRIAHRSSRHKRRRECYRRRGHPRHERRVGGGLPRGLRRRRHRRVERRQGGHPRQARRAAIAGLCGLPTRIPARRVARGRRRGAGWRQRRQARHHGPMERQQRAPQGRHRRRPAHRNLPAQLPGRALRRRHRPRRSSPAEARHNLGNPSRAGQRRGRDAHRRRRRQAFPNLHRQERPIAHRSMRHGTR